MSRKRILTQVSMYFLMLMSLMVMSCEWDDIEDFFEGEKDTYSISGQVTLNGVGASGVSIHITGEESRTEITDQNGNYVINDLDNGDYTLSPSSGSLVFTPSSVDVTIDDSCIEGINFEAENCCGN